MAMRRTSRARGTPYMQVETVPVYQAQYAQRTTVPRPIASRIPNPALVGRYRRTQAPAALYTKSVETKSVDTPASFISFATAGAVNPTPLNVPVSGAAFYQRVGNKITMKSLHFHGFITVSGANAAAVGMQLGRIIVFYDR